MIKVKVCGVTTYENALMVAQCGVDLLGLNFYKPSPRSINPEDARYLCSQLRAVMGASCPVLVGVFVNDSVDEVAHILRYVGLDFAQLSGDESAAMVAELRGRAFKAIRPMDESVALDDAAYYAPYFPQNDHIPSLLIDAYHPGLYGGTGEGASQTVAQTVKAQVPRMMLAGGLKPENVGERVRAIQPWGVDTASGVEDGIPGIKSEAKVKAFVTAAKSIEVAGD
ncbi:phosphoribosylanthranilate isomerase [Phototrophicus methaneseepsis]|uniref:N-(5'-phosphoribosyl)anthranilate isomerase n=1 Tax=Phototrophicus methaneseepsis TaxID=2710758 RepID=A0A7S8IDG6_9CHLR|nr:phosphoribosylanthranilate isomerase [Phototrophicus methaneseepsis]QPC80773.1 phosphoribosylanthranilate isomerase [Phototrophicus methaneseepsis]